MLNREFVNKKLSHVFKRIQNYNSKNEKEKAKHSCHPIANENKTAIEGIQTKAKKTSSVTRAKRTIHVVRESTKTTVNLNNFATNNQEKIPNKLQPLMKTILIPKPKLNPIPQIISKSKFKPINQSKSKLKQESYPNRIQI